MQNLHFFFNFPINSTLYFITKFLYSTELLPTHLHLYRVSIGETERFQIQERYLNFFSFPSGHDQLYKTPPGKTDEIV